MYKFLQGYPFSDSNVRLVEGFSAYDGVLKDEVGAPHKGIDYVLQEADAFKSFEVYAMHDGMAFQGVSESWGTFVIVYGEHTQGKRYSTVYAHLDEIPADIVPQTFEENGERKTTPIGTLVIVGKKLGRTGVNGWTNGIIQLHLELHEKDETSGATAKLDPYGVNDRASSGKYRQPGEPLTRLDHAWVNDTPPLAG